MTGVEPTTPGFEDQLLGRTIAGRYEVFSKLGQGGMGAVYAARQAPLGRTVALKVLLEELTSDPVASGRFEKEALLVSRLAHPNIVTILDFGSTEQGQKFISMEYLDGRTLRAVLAKDGTLSPRRTVRIMMYIARALSEAHRHDIVHRDLKPDNIIIVPTTSEPDFLKVLDFGVAKLRNKDGQHTSTLTQADVIVGTPKYMSPEQINGVADDPRSDLYALGIMAYEMLTGRVPFEAESAVKVLMKHLQDDPPPLREVAPEHRGSPLLENLIMQLLAKEVSDRPASAARLLELLEDLPEYTGPRARLQTVANAPAFNVADLLRNPPTAETNGPVGRAREAGVVPTPQRRPPTQPRADGGDGVFTHTRLDPIQDEGTLVADPTDETALPLGRAATDKDLPVIHAEALPVDPSASTPAMPMPAVRGGRSRVSHTLEVERGERGGAPAGHQRASLGKLVAGGFALAVGAGALGMVLLGGKGPPPTPVDVPPPVPVTAPVAEKVPAAGPSPTAAASPSPSPAREPLPGPDPVSPASAEPVAAPPREDPDPDDDKERGKPRSRQPQVRVTFISVPAGAEVSEGGTSRGRTPMVLPVPKDGRLRTFTLKMSGYREELRAVRGDRDRSVEVRMEKEKAAPAPAAATPPVAQARAPAPTPVQPTPEPAPAATPAPAPAPAKKEAARKEPVFEKWDDLKDPVYK